MPPTDRGGVGAGGGVTTTDGVAAEGLPDGAGETELEQATRIAVSGIDQIERRRDTARPPGGATTD